MKSNLPMYLILVAFALIAIFSYVQRTAQSSPKILYQIGNQFYDSDPSAPLITGNDIQKAKNTATGVIVLYTDYAHLYNQYEYRCFSLKNEGTQALTVAQSVATGTTSREQMMNFYSIALDAIGREEACQAAIAAFSNWKPGIVDRLTINVNSLNSELSQNRAISQSDENIEMTNYNNVASSFNSKIKTCTPGLLGNCHQA